MAGDQSQAGGWNEHKAPTVLSAAMDADGQPDLSAASMLGLPRCMVAEFPDQGGHCRLP